MENNSQTFEIVYTELEGQMPVVIGVSGKTREDAEKAFLKSNVDKYIVRDPAKQIYVVNAQTIE